MGSRIFLRGRLLAASPDTRAEAKRAREAFVANGWPEILAAQRAESLPGGALVKAAKITEPEPIRQPLPPAPRTVSYPSTVTDGESGVTYRVVNVLRVEEGWVTALTCAGWFKIQPHTVHHLARIGLLDAAMEVNSPTRRFRVRSVEKVRAEIARLREEKRALLRSEGAAGHKVDGVATLAGMKLGGTRKGTKGEKR